MLIFWAPNLIFSHFFNQLLSQLRKYPFYYVICYWGEKLFIYLAVSDVAVSASLFKDCEDRSQRLVFFFSKSLADIETRYTHLEQAALSLQMAAKKLRPYFQAHPIMVLTNLPLRSTIYKPDLSRRMTRWAIELSEYGIHIS